ncbi:5'/3'-nucleotidase SurE [Muricoccus aerilatus]|uniref:5'/3'-nucleotidase SurE n=1 Tax=Muricoccus aerilatus TaxID=452982 RepID=UPI0006948C37|nr:5'/3'-nucleotidase SurE [Roseomonas aerilata]
MPRIFSTDFTGFTAAGFSATPGSGALDSNVWRVVGLSDNPAPPFGYEGASGTDFGRGTIATNDPTTAGVYSPVSNPALVLQPTGGELDANGFIEARVQNISGASAAEFSVNFDWVARNSAPRSDSLTFSYSTNGTDFVAVPAASFSSSAEAAPGAAFTETAAAPVTLTGLSVGPNDYLYLRWTHTGSSSSGNRDEVGIDNVSVDATTGGTSAGTTVSINDVIVTEGNAGSSTASFTVTRSDTSGSFDVRYETADGTATTGDNDYASSSGVLHFAAGGAASQTVAVTVTGDAKAEPDEIFTVGLSDLVNEEGSAALGDATGTGTIRNDDVAATPIYEIQGAGDTSPLVGRTVTTQGIVTALSSGSNKGFYIQDSTGDGNPTTSDGVFVFTGSAPAGIAVGDLVAVTGRVQEYSPSSAAPGALTLTEISGVTGTTVLSHGNPVPAPVVIGTAGLQIPDTDVAVANAAYERLEGMLVRVEDPLVVGPTNNFGEIFTVASGGAGASGLNSRGDLLISGGAPAFGYTDTVGGDLNPERIQLDPGLGISLPNVSTGARLGGVTGVVGYDFGNYQVLATASPAVVQASPLTKAPSSLTGDANHLLVGSYNAENLDPGDGQSRFATIAGEITGKLNSPDIIALQEIQDDTGAADNGVTAADLTLGMITGAIDAAGGPHYALLDNPFIGNDTNGGEPGGNIRAAFLYRTDRVSFVEGSLATIAADGSPIRGGTYTDQQTNPDNPFYGSRPPLSATFTFNGESVTVLSNHFTSKGGSAALYGSQQPPFDGGEVQRAAQAQAVNSYVDGLLATDAHAKVVVAGDLNDFGFEQPLSVLKGVATVTNYDVPGRDPIAATATYTPGGAQVLADLQDTLPPDQRFDYVFEGNAETLDHMLVTGALAQGAQFEPVHINAEFYDQTSDHDPLVGRFAISAQGEPPVAPTPLNIVLTNDDGYNAPGIQTLYNALVSAGHNVHIVAPAVNQSAQGSSLGGTSALSSPISITEFSPGNYYVDGRPATATLVGLDDLFSGNRPDLVISGTNRGENIGESENISGTVNGAVQALFEGVPAIAISAGSFQGSYDAAFANSANFMVDFLHQLQSSQAAGQSLLPVGSGLTVNVPGNPVLAGIAVTTVTQESTSSFPYALTPSGAYAEGFVTNTSPSGSPTSEGSQFLTNHITISPIDGNWGSTEADRDALAVRLGSTPGNVTPPHAPLDILLLNEDGHGSHGIEVTRDALLAQGHDVTVLAPSTDQSGVGSALFLNPVTVTQYAAKDYASTGTSASLVAVGLDPQGLLQGVHPDLVVVGADHGDAVGIENANHSATVSGAITALFNYGVPSIALSSHSGSDADLATSAQFLTSLIANLEATQGASTSLLPEGVGLSINVPTGATASHFAFTTIDGATDANLGVVGNASAAAFVYGGSTAGTSPYSEGEAFNAGLITVSPIDGNIAVRDAAVYDSLAQTVGTTYGVPSHAPATIALQISEDAYLGDAQFIVTVDGQQLGGVQTATASHAAGGSQTVALLDFFDTDISAVSVKFINDAWGGTPASDRNLYVDKLTFNGQTYEAEHAVNNAGPTYATDAGLEREGSLDFRTASTIGLHVSEDAYQGDAQFLILVNGQQAGGVQTVTASHAAGQYQEIVLSGNYGDVRSVDVQFINDRWDGSDATDRNLYVDKLTVDGKVHEGEAAVNNAAGTPFATEARLDQNGTLHFDHLLG